MSIARRLVRSAESMGPATSSMKGPHIIKVLHSHEQSVAVSHPAPSIRTPAPAKRATKVGMSAPLGFKKAPGVTGSGKHSSPWVPRQTKAGPYAAKHRAL